MPHATLEYSADLEIDAAAILAQIEATVLAHDAGAGDTKGRAYAVQSFHHTHCKAEVAILVKPHRDAAFVDALKLDLAAAIANHLPRPCWLSVDVVFSGPGYHTEELT